MIERNFLGSRMITADIRIEAVKWNADNVIRVSAKQGRVYGDEFIPHTHGWAWLNYYTTTAIPHRKEDVDIILEYAEIVLLEKLAERKK